MFRDLGKIVLVCGATVSLGCGSSSSECEPMCDVGQVCREGSCEAGGGAGSGNPGSGGTGTGGQGTGVAGSGDTTSTGGNGTGGNGTGGNGTGGNGTGGNGTGGSPTFTNYIENDVFWKDTSGETIYSQGGGVLQVGSTFYWYGVKYNGAVTYAANPTSKNGDIGFAGVTIYSSTDLVQWKHENTVKLANAGGWFGRLGVVYNKNTKKYVLVAQGGGGLYFATSDTPAGNFVFNNVQTNLPGVVNGGTGDQTTFQDDDGKAYIIASNIKGRSHMYVIPLRASDYLQAEQAVEIFKGAGREGNAMFKHEGRYYACSSDLHGWNTSQTYCVSATNIRGPYGAEFVMPGTEKDYSHVTQNGFYITVHGSQQQLVIYAGDRWSDFAGNGIGFNQWVPLDFSGIMPHFNSLSHWAPDVATGLWSVGPKNNYALNPSFEADRISVTQPVGWTATSSANAQGGHTGRWNWTLHGNSKLSQAAIELPNGTYTLTAWVKSTGGQSSAQLYAKPAGGNQKATSINTKISGWEQRSVSEIQVTSGTCEIGVTTQGSDVQTVSIDDFTLIRVQ